MNLEYIDFIDVDLDDPFFDSLKSDYQEFPDWFKKNMVQKPIYIEIKAAL